MKAKKLVGLGFASMMLLSSGGASVFAQDVEVIGEKGQTEVTVIIEDGQFDPDNPYEPIEPGQKHLTLESVPSKYNFTTVVSNTNYTITDHDVEGTIDVFNDNSLRKWLVKASVVGDQLTRDTKKYPVTAFAINGTKLATGVETTVAQNEDYSGEKNTGLIQTKVDSIEISFVDSENNLKAGNELKGAINYRLFLVMPAN